MFGIGACIVALTAVICMLFAGSWLMHSLIEQSYEQGKPDDRTYQFEVVSEGRAFPIEGGSDARSRILRDRASGDCYRMIDYARGGSGGDTVGGLTRIKCPES